VALERGPHRITAFALKALLANPSDDPIEPGCWLVKNLRGGR
jgi:hypothetical protein